MKPIALTIIALLLILPLASAATTIKLKTIPGHDVFISVWDTAFETQHQSPGKSLSDINGDVQYIYDGTSTPFGVLVIVKAFGVEKYREEFGPYNIGSVIQLPDILPDALKSAMGISSNISSNVTNVTENETTNNTSENNSQNNSEVEETLNTTGSLTGNVAKETGGNESSFSEILTSSTAKTVYYVFGAIFILAMFLLIITYTVAKIRSPKKIPYGMEPVNLNRQSRQDSSGDKYLDKIEKEIDDVDRQIDQYKKRNILDDAQRRLEEKKKMLERLKRSGNPMQNSTPRRESYSSSAKRDSSLSIRRNNLMPKRENITEPAKDNNNNSSPGFSNSNNTNNPNTTNSNTSQAGSLTGSSGSSMSSTREDRENRYKKRFY